MKERGDFTAEYRLVYISALGVCIGTLCAVVALVLLKLIALFTNFFYFQQFSFHALDETHSLVTRVHELGWWSVLIPVVGGLIIGFMARYGSDRIRGHGIPEALEAILIGRSRMSPKVAVLKPLSSAVSIGSGGPFGAEGPIIMTGGACGSIIAQIFRLTAAERKTLLVAGAAGGMAATFATPMAAVLLAVELLLFEWKPRSLVPVALACAAAMLVRPFLLEHGPLFPIPSMHTRLGLESLSAEQLGMMQLNLLLCAAFVGLLAGVLALMLTGAVYAMEDLFHKVPVHWMWWPALGGLAVGIGGVFQPRALGVGYDIIHDLLQGDFQRPEFLKLLLLLLFVKCAIWSIALGSGTSGGVLAPLLIMGGAMGALEAKMLPVGDSGLWALVGMGAVMGGTMRSPFTGAIFALELTQDISALPALMLASFVSYGFTVLLMKRSILTEKVARRGYHITREYSIDPLERSVVREVMTTNVVTIPASMPVKELLKIYFHSGGLHRHQAYPVVDATGRILGVLTRTNLLEDWVRMGLGTGQDSDVMAMTHIIAFDLIQRPPITIFPEESCRTAAERMAEAGVGRLPVVSEDDPTRMIGIVTRSDLLKPRASQVEEEVKRERFIGLHRDKLPPPI